MGKRLTWVDFVSHNIQRGDYDWTFFCLLLYTLFRGGMAQWVASLSNVLGREFEPHQQEQETLPLLFSTGWFQEQIRA